MGRGGRWLPFVALVTVLVFSQARLYASRERRSGFGRVVSSLLVVALLTFAFGLGTGHEFSTFGLIPTTLVFSAVLIGLFRASYDVVTREMFQALGVHRRAVLAGEGEHLLELYRTLGSGRGGIDYELVGLVSASEPDCRCRCSGARTRCARPRVEPGRRADRHRLGLRRAAAARHGRPGHRAGVHVRIAPRTTELLTKHADFVPGQGIPLFEIRPPVLVGFDWVAEARLRHGRVDRRAPDRPADLGRDRPWP